MRVNITDYPNLQHPFSRYMIDNHGVMFLTSTLAKKVLLEQFGVRCTISPGSNLWFIDMIEEDYIWFKLRWS